MCSRVLLALREVNCELAVDSGYGGRLLKMDDLFGGGWRRNRKLTMVRFQRIWD
jgi:hypothetical protein